MFHECFGVPYMKWYGRQAVRRMFGEFADVNLTSVGANLGRLAPSAGPSRLGYFWVIEATKHR
jgi:hypothetical protein